MVATLLRPEAGPLGVCGHGLPAGATTARTLIRYLGHDPLVYLDLTPQQNLELYADLYGLSDSRERIAAASTASACWRAVRSGAHPQPGMVQRLGLARAPLLVSRAVAIYAYLLAVEVVAIRW